MKKLRDLKYELLEHPLDSLDLASSDFHLFSNLNKFVGRKSFSLTER
jgi:hypothetical protein